ncbi:MAG: hypothetical protein ACK47B_14400 [Armatimonadota bacterium]
MARPPVEWPIPIYTLELRERTVGIFRVPASRLARQVPPPISLETFAGTGLVAVCVGSARCLKPVGGAAQLASEFHLVEVVTPVRWQGACRPLLRGLFALDLLTDCSGVRRLLECGLQVPARRARAEQELSRQRVSVRVGTSSGAGFGLAGPDPLREGTWPEGSCLSGLEEAELRLLRPDSYFFPDSHQPLVRAVPVHQYSRLTVARGDFEMAAPLLAELLRCPESEIVPDLALVQKRCTYTIAFPPERIPTAPAVAPRRALVPEPLRLAA